MRFATNESALKFLQSPFEAESTLLQGEEEKTYWDKINDNKNTKHAKEKRKQRGRDKLLKRAERELGKHIRFDEPE